ncbi:MAG: pyruvate, phosphate dikinase [Firmicutes bacterium]|nr:pyruvate, phosphate dikinase [Bacillota bacterium]MDY5856150.1 pyruvate, phosphate dikinase [Anaerovoracaceae bacterium]
MKKYVYSFNEGSKDMRSLLGGKGANLAEMTRIGLPVPFGFTITTEACNRYYDEGQTIAQDLIDAIYEKIAELEEVSGKTFGSNENPLLVSVRSGAVISMPGMMDTILNLGLNDQSVEGLAALTENRRFAMDSYRRFIQMFGDVVQEIPKAKFDKVFDGQKAARGVKFDVDLTAEDLEQVIEGYKQIVKEETGKDFPQDPKEQLIEAVKAVFRSWNNDRAILYRNLNGIAHDLGTAVNVQSMVFGNMGDTSGTGVAFTRNPADGTNEIFGEFLVNAQGEDVVAGVRTPMDIKKMADAFPQAYSDFIKIADLLEKHYKDVQDMEFTVERGKLYMLQTRSGKRTAQAAVKIAVDMVGEGLIDKKTAVTRLEPEQIDQLLHPMFDAAELKGAKSIAKGLPASPGAACGQIYFTAEEAVAAAADGAKTLLVREETSPEDLAGMVAAEGILTARGGMTSHAAVVARGMGKCCVAGCSAILVDEEAKTLTVGDAVYKEGDFISINGADGQVYEGKIKTVVPEMSGDFGTIMGWADEIRELKVRTNADNPRDAKQALEFGAEGIGLCRTEHMFFEEERIPAIRRMILADTVEERKEALNALRPYQQGDFKAMFKVMGELPVTIRLLDPPLHEFLPQNEEDIRALADLMGVTYEKLAGKVTELHEQNPMLGHRGCRLAVTYPEIAVMQTEAIMMAALEVKKEDGYDIIPEIMIPLVGSEAELKYVKNIVVEAADRCIRESGIEMNYMVGTMIETPRAALTADEIAKDAEFFSFGTNDLTQMTFGFSRDDTGKLIQAYIDKGILEEDPFQVIDEDGVGKLVSMASTMGRQTRPKIKLGICGEHGGNPKTIDFCHRAGLNYVSCSPFRVPIARLAAAQAAIRNPQK